jgi:glycosyltransferase involved in cell wall biosynthesis
MDLGHPARSVYDPVEDVVQAKLNRADLSVVISTYNRAEILSRALESLVRQDLDPSRYEVIVVDNNSTDHTREIVRSFGERKPRVVYCFEARQGVAFGRNSGSFTASAPIIAFTDDDVRVPEAWASTILTVFSQHPEAACVGGKVLPRWTAPPPPWLTFEHWAPLALLDYGDTPFFVNTDHRLCLIAANMAFRRSVLNEIGLFSPDVQTVRRKAGTEDHELLLRLWRRGGQGLYWPGLIAVADVPRDRMSRAYHRRWHYRHGHLLATMHDEQLERTKRGAFLGVPGHLYRQVVSSSWSWLFALLELDLGGAFKHEVRMWSGMGFLAARWAEFVRRLLNASRSGEDPAPY